MSDEILSFVGTRNRVNLPRRIVYVDIGRNDRSLGIDNEEDRTINLP